MLLRFAIQRESLAVAGLRVGHKARVNVALATPPQVRAPAPRLLQRVLGIALLIVSFSLAAAVIANKHTIDGFLAGAGIGCTAGSELCGK
jgi:hypothetical protein